MLYPLPPPPFAASDVTIKPRNVVGVAESPLTLQQQVYQWPGQRWEVEAKFPPMPRLKAEQLIGWLNALQGQTGTFCFGDISALLGQGLFAANGVPLATSGSQAAGKTQFSKLVVRSDLYQSPTAYAAALAAGDYLQIGGLNVIPDSRGNWLPESGTIVANSQTDPYGLANGASRVSTYVASGAHRIIAQLTDTLLAGGMLSAWVRPSVASNWTLAAYNSDVALANSTVVAVPANTWTRICLPLTYELLLELLYNTVTTYIATGNCITDQAGNFSRAAGTGSSWNGSAVYSKLPFTNGATMDVTPSQSGTQALIGLSALPFDTSYPSPTFAWSFQGANIYCFQSGAQVAGPFAYSAGDDFTIRYDGAKVTWYQTGNPVYSAYVQPNLKLWFMGLVYAAGHAFTNLIYQATNNNGDTRGREITSFALVGGTNCATVDVGAICYDPSGGIEYNRTDPTVAIAPQGFAHLYKTQARAEYYGGMYPTVWPRLRSTYATATNVKSSFARGVFRLAGEHDWTIDRARFYGLTLKAIESP